MSILIERLGSLLLESSDKIKVKEEELRSTPLYKFKERGFIKDFIKLERRFMRNIIKRIQEYDN